MVVIDIVTLVVTVVIVVVDYLLLFGLMQAAGSRWSTKFQNKIVSSFSMVWSCYASYQEIIHLFALLLCEGRRGLS